MSRRVHLHRRGRLSLVVVAQMAWGIGQAAQTATFLPGTEESGGRKTPVPRWLPPPRLVA